MDFKQIEAFVNVIKYKSFSKAADALFLTQPTISAHIASLEKELGMQLVDRGGRQASPTKQGKLFFSYAADMINIRETAVSELQNYSSAVDGILEIQTSSIPGGYLVPNLAAGFCKTYPSVRCFIEQTDSLQVMENILSGKGEIGFTGEKQNNGLTYEAVLEDKQVLITPKTEKFLSLSKNTATVADFIDEPFLLREEGSATRKELEKGMELSRHKLQDLRIVAKMNNSEAIKKAVSAGMGVSILSGVAAAEPAELRSYLVFDIEGMDTKRKFYLAHNAKITLSPTAVAFRRFVLENRA